MSLNRFSYLEAWEHNPAGGLFRRREQAPDSESDDEDEIHQNLPEEPSLSSSFPSVLSHRSVRHRLSFNPVAGPGWNESAVESADAERQSLLGHAVAAGHAGRVSDHGTGRDSVCIDELHGCQRALLKEPEWTVPESRPAFEVSKGKRIGRLKVLIY